MKTWKVTLKIIETPFKQATARYRINNRLVHLSAIQFTEIQSLLNLHKYYMQKSHLDSANML